MMKKTLLALLAAATILPAVPAAADDRWDRDDRREWRDDRRDDRRDYRDDRRDDRREYRQERRERMYDSNGRYYEPRRVSRGDRVWAGRDGRYYCERDNGTTGLIIGAAGGALLGRTVDTRGDRTVGTVVGGILGGLLGREIDRGEARCR